MLSLVAFNDCLLQRLLAFMIAASSGTKLEDARCCSQSNYTMIDDTKTASFLLNPLPGLHFRPFF